MTSWKQGSFFAKTNMICQLKYFLEKYYRGVLLQKNPYSEDASLHQAVGIRRGTPALLFKTHPNHTATTHTPCG
ncbi:MAG: hypothetical protein RR772_10140, partial [Gordonibacter sp.]